MAKPYLGIWVDHRHAYLIWIDEHGQADTQYLETEQSDRGQKTGRMVSGPGGVFGGVAPHANLELKRQQEARRLYEKVFRAVRKAESVCIFGPGKAKDELCRYLKAHKELGSRVVAVRSAGKMTQAQMVACVRDFLGLPRPAL